MMGLRRALTTALLCASSSLAQTCTSDDADFDFAYTVLTGMTFYWRWVQARL